MSSSAASAIAGVTRPAATARAAHVGDVDARAVVLDREAEAVAELARTERDRPARGLPSAARMLGRLDAVRDGVAHELEARLDELLGDAPVDRLVGAARAHDDRAPAAPRLGLDGRREAREDAADGRLSHGRELLLRVGDVVAQRVLGRVQARGRAVELLAERAQRGRDDLLDAAERGGRRAPRPRRADEAQRLDEGAIAARAASGGRSPRCAPRASDRSRASSIDVEPLEQAVDVDGRDADRRGRLVEPEIAAGRTRSRTDARGVLGSALLGGCDGRPRARSVARAVSGSSSSAPSTTRHARPPASPSAPVARSRRRRAAPRARGRTSSSARRRPRSPRPSSCARAGRRCARRLDRVVAGRERARRCARAGRCTSAAYWARTSGSSGARDEVVGRDGPARHDGGLARRAGAATAVRTRRRGLAERASSPSFMRRSSRSSVAASSRSPASPALPFSAWMARCAHRRRRAARASSVTRWRSSSWRGGARSSGSRSPSTRAHPGSPPRPAPPRRAGAPAARVAGRSAPTSSARGTLPLSAAERRDERARALARLGDGAHGLRIASGRLLDALADVDERRLRVARRAGARAPSPA